MKSVPTRSETSSSFSQRSRVLARLLLGAVVGLSAASFAQPLGDEFERWQPPQPTKPDGKGVLAACAALDRAIKVADVEGAAELLEFPVSLLTDESVPAVTLDRAHWVGLVESAIEAVLRQDLKLEARYEASFLSDSLAVVTVSHAASRGRITKQWKSVYVLVRRGSAWKVKGLGGAGWGALPNPRPDARGRALLPPPIELFNKRCATCHGPDGKGATVVGVELQIPDLTDPKLQDRLTDQQVLTQILEGSFDKVTGQPRMTSYRDVYPEAELKALVPVVRSFRRKAAPR